MSTTTNAAIIECRTHVNGRLVSGAKTTADEALWALAVEVAAGAKVQADHDPATRAYRLTLTHHNGNTTVYACGPADDE